MKRKSLLHSLPFVAKALGDKMGVRVQVSGDRAYTNGDVVNIPCLPEDDETAAILARGHLDHEVGHIRHTDFTVVPFQPETFPHVLWNTIEDPYGDEMMGNLFPGSKINLRNRLEWLVKNKGALKLPEEGEIPPVQAFLNWLMTKLQWERLGHRICKELMEDSEEAMEEIFPPHLIAELNALADKAKAVSSTVEAVAVTHQVLSTLKDWATNPPPPPPQPPQHGEEESGASGQQDEPADSSQRGGGGNGDSQSDSDQDGSQGAKGKSSDPSDNSDDSQEDSDGSGQSGAQDDSADDSDSSQGGGSDPDQSDDESDGTGQSGDPGDSDDDADGSNAGDSSGTGGNGAGDGNGQDLAETLTSILNASEEDLKGWDLGEMLAEELGERADATSAAAIQIPEEEKPKAGVTDVHRVRATTAALRSRLAGLVQAIRHQAIFPKRSGRQLDTRVLTRLARKDPRVFRSQQETVAVNTAVMILLDRSGSMAGPRVEVAQDAVLASALAMGAIPGVSVASAAFPGRENYRDSVIPLTRFGQSVRATTKYYALGANGGTPLTEALWWAATQILRQPEPRKIILVATDGDPNDVPSAKAAIKRLAAEGIEFLGLGIQHTAVSVLFPNYSVIHDLTDLPNALFGMLQKELTRRKAA